jgi:hypothetical protein
MNKILIILASLILASCGGGGDVGGIPPSSTNNNTPTFGNLGSPYLEGELKNSGIKSPNGYVKSAASGRIFDLRQGRVSSREILSNSDNVNINIKTTSDLNVILSPYGYQTFVYSYPQPNSASMPLNQTSASFQNQWITREVAESWSEGINGYGVQISILDDFTVDDLSDLQLRLFDSECSNLPFDKTPIKFYFCPNISLLSYEMTHGQQVAQILSGKQISYDGAVIYSGPYRISETSFIDLGLATQYQKLNISYGTPIYGVAFGAAPFTKREDYLTHQSNTNGIFDQFKKWTNGFDSVSMKFKSTQIINLSLGGTSSNPVTNRSTYATQLALANSTNNVPDALFVKAAGNNSCNISSSNCDPINAVLYNSPVYNKKTIIVGALNKNLLASYSNKAANYSSRFLVADGRGVLRSDGEYEQGTSFAAPRVSGYAAMLRQKYPNLTSEDVADIILSTATWNSKWGLKNSETQKIYGQGQANLERALNPIGFLP